MATGAANVPIPTPILRFTHVENLRTILRRGALHAPSTMPTDGLPLRLTHHLGVQAARGGTRIFKGPGGTIHDYVPFYFGQWSPMMLNLKTGRVPGYTDGQKPLVFLVTTAQEIADRRLGFVFTDGQALSRISQQFDDLGDLGKVDWPLVTNRYWRNTSDDPDRQRRKQAEFLVHAACPWILIDEIVVYDASVQANAEAVMAEFPIEERRPVHVNRNWYFA